MNADKGDVPDLLEQAEAAGVGRCSVSIYGKAVEMLATAMAGRSLCIARSGVTPRQGDVLPFVSLAEKNRHAVLGDQGM
jgi:hypothetical protein